MGGLGFRGQKLGSRVWGLGFQTLYQNVSEMPPNYVHFFLDFPMR